MFERKQGRGVPAGRGSPARPAARRGRGVRMTGGRSGGEPGARGAQYGQASAGPWRMPGRSEGAKKAATSCEKPRRGAHIRLEARTAEWGNPRACNGAHPALNA